MVVATSADPAPTVVAALSGALTMVLTLQEELDAMGCRALACLAGPWELPLDGGGAG